MEKNFAKEFAENLCESVKKNLLNTKTNSFTTLTTYVKNSLKERIAKILTPKEDLYLLRKALTAKKRGEPYKIIFLGNWLIIEIIKSSFISSYRLFIKIIRFIFINNLFIISIWSNIIIIFNNFIRRLFFIMFFPEKFLHSILILPFPD